MNEVIDLIFLLADGVSMRTILRVLIAWVVLLPMLIFGVIVFIPFLYFVEWIIDDIGSHKEPFGDVFNDWLSWAIPFRS